jgi:hypothetical protein
MESRKYERTYHLPYSPGTTSDDKVQMDYWHHLSRMQQIVFTEKLDGENNCLNRHGVFARSHAAPTVSPWTARLRERWAHIKSDLDELEIFGENVYAVHSIEYTRLEDYFFVFAARYRDQWLDWEEVCFCANALNLPLVPVLGVFPTPVDEHAFTKIVLELAGSDSVFGSIDANTGLPCRREGVVVRDFDAFPVGQLSTHVLKYVRKDHVQTSEHWTRNWRPARLINHY